ncbi:hypothetical protein ACLFMI_13695 [Pseudonocardia nantongensis]|uniref:hypothetical protein n=1 Tax=Pseudonocardia nantongensis TaxID=1181885 RepID=UPI00397C09EA
MPVEQLSYGLPIREYLLVGLVSAVVALLLTGPVRMLALKVGAVAWPRGRDVHVTPTPRWGGLAMFGGVLAGLLLALQLPALRLAYFEGSTDVFGTVIAAALLVGIGLLDDRYDLDAITKFAAQVTAGGLLVLYGVQWLTLWIPLGGGGTGISGSTLVLGQAQGVMFTVLVTVSLVNAMNFVDGLDGLAAGIGLITSLAIAVFCMGLIRENGNDPGSYAPGLIAVVLAGACLGFLPHNFNPARIFMGDTGSMLVGVMLAAATTSASGRLIGISDETTATDFLGLLAPVIVVIGIVFIPLLDLLLAVVRRTRAGASPFSPDKMHLHHRLLQVGHSHRRAVLLVYLWVAVLAFGSVGLALLPQTGLVLAAIAIALVVAFVASAVPHRSRMRTAAAQAAPGTTGAGGSAGPPAAGVDTDRTAVPPEGAGPAPAPPPRPAETPPPPARPGETPPIRRDPTPLPARGNGTPPVRPGETPPPAHREGPPPARPEPAAPARPAGGPAGRPGPPQVPGRPPGRPDPQPRPGADPTPPPPVPPGPGRRPAGAPPDARPGGSPPPRGQWGAPVAGRPGTPPPSPPREPWRSGPSAGPEAAAGGRARPPAVPGTGAGPRPAGNAAPGRGPGTGAGPRPADSAGPVPPVDGADGRYDPADEPGRPAPIDGRHRPPAPGGAQGSGDREQPTVPTSTPYPPADDGRT